jgi:hypothetical protein
MAVAFTGLTAWGGMSALGLTVLLLVIFQTGHSLSPIALAWAHRGFREHMLRNPSKFVGFPIAMLIVLSLAGYLCGQFWPRPTFNPVTLKIGVSSYWNPLFAMALVYGAWNIYHFGKQNFGVISIYRHRAGWYAARQRRFDLVFCCLTSWSIMAVSLIHLAANYLRWEVLGYWPVAYTYLAVAATLTIIMLLRERQFCLPRLVLILTSGIGMGTAMFWPIAALGIVSMNHWLVAIGLAGHASRRPLWVFCPLVIIAGIALYCALFVDMAHLVMPTTFAAAAVAFRLAMGQVHFLYDRWVWKLSDPQVRATIGRDLLRN